MKWLKQISGFVKSRHDCEVSTYFSQLTQCVHERQSMQIAFLRRECLRIITVIGWLALFFVGLPPNSIWLSLDMWHTFQHSPVFYLTTSAVAFDGWHYQWLLYFVNHTPITWAIRDILLKSRFHAVFLTSYWYKQWHVTTYLHRYSTQYWLIMFLFRVLTGFLLSLISLLVVRFVRNRWNQGDSMSSLCFQTFLLSLSTYHYVRIIQTYLETTGLISHLALVSGRIIHVLLWQSKQWLKPMPYFYWIRLTRLISHTMRYVSQANQCYGVAMFSFLVVNMPANCYMVTLLLTGRVSPPISQYCIIIVAEQIFGIVGVHSVAAILNYHLTQPTKPLYGLILRARRPIRVRLLLRLAFHLEVFHSRQTHGFSYGRYGRISSLSLVKVK